MPAKKDSRKRITNPKTGRKVLATGTVGKSIKKRKSIVKRTPTKTIKKRTLAKKTATKKTPAKKTKTIKKRTLAKKTPAKKTPIKKKSNKKLGKKSYVKGISDSELKKYGLGPNRWYRR